MKLDQLPVPDRFKELILKEGSLWVKRFVSNSGLRLLYSLDKTQHGDLHHLSISRSDRYPDWDEIVRAKEEIMGDVDTMMIIPKRRDYINLSKNCFHIWETPETWNVF